MGSDPKIVKAVQNQNAQKLTLEEIKKRDKKWRDTPGLDDFMKSLLNSSCGKYLQDLQKKNDFYAEIFIMDNQGANVAMSDKTSDYWQGDEAKFTESYKNGKGSIHISEVEFDDSTQEYLVQVSVPVIKGKKVIGAITFGINIDRIEDDSSLSD